MKKLILASAAVLLMGASVSFAAMPAIDLSDVLAVQSSGAGLQLARNGGDDGGGDDHGGGGNSGHGGQGGGHSGHGGGDDDDDGDHHSSNHDHSDDDTGSGSGRKKPRVPKGSGCDGAGDVAEHASCSAGQ